MRKIILVLEFFKKYFEVAETNFKDKGLVIEWKLAARKSFEKMILYRVSTNSPIDIYKSSLELSHLFGTTSLDLCLTQNHNFYWKLRKMQTDQDMVAYYLRKWDFDSKDSKWVFEMHFNEEHLRKVFYSKIKGINLKTTKHKK